ncbi:MAG TPA: GNAT family N-acetyltransferase, partial [Flavobacteriales bacterium]|nr:GNAT family N-acetyltransferase [Flavobacteriales bacterium]
DQFHSIVRLRIGVFVVEQDCPYPELDAKDLNSIQVYALKIDENIDLGDSAVACVRISAPGVSYPEPSIGRVATRPDCRKIGLGIDIMKRAIDVSESTYPGQGIRISAQCYLEKFYSDLGFSSTGETYLEDDILHIQMFRPSSS